MGHKDRITKKFMSNPEIFADFFNGFVYEGKSVIKSDSLEEMDSSSIINIPYAKGMKSIDVQKIRDIIKSTVIMKSDKMYYMLLGLENQSDVHYAMPVRKMLYDALTYAEQVEAISKQRKNDAFDSSVFLSGIAKEDKLKPVITITLYWGMDSWDAPTSLKEMLTDLDPKIEKFIDDCHINLFSIVDLAKIPDFKTELKELFALLNARNDSEKFEKVVFSDEAYKHVSREVAELMKTFASIKIPRKNKEGDYDMCKAVVELREKGIEEGKTEAEVNAIKNLMENMGFTFEQAIDALGVSKDKVEKYKRML